MIGRRLLDEFCIDFEHREGYVPLCVDRRSYPPEEKKGLVAGGRGGAEPPAPGGVPKGPTWPRFGVVAVAGTPATCLYLTSYDLLKGVLAPEARARARGRGRASRALCL